MLPTEVTVEERGSRGRAGMGPLQFPKCPALCQTCELHGGQAGLELGWARTVSEGGRALQDATEERERPPVHSIRGI